MSNIIVAGSYQNVGNTRGIQIFNDGLILVDSDSTFNIRLIETDSQYYYISVGYYLYKCTRDFTIVDSILFGNYIASMILDGNYIYLTIFDGFLYRISLSPFQVYDSVSVGGTCRDLAINSTYIYVQNPLIKSYLKSDLSYVATSIVSCAEVGHPHTIIANETDVYCTTHPAATNVINRLDAVSLTVQATSNAADATNIVNFAINDTYLYECSDDWLRRRDKNTLVTQETVSFANGLVEGVVADNDYLYTTSYNQNVRRYDADDLTTYIQYGINMRGLDLIFSDYIPQAPPTNLAFVESGQTLTTAPITWTNNNNGSGYNLIQYKDLTFGTNGGNWIDAGTVSWSATTFTITGLIPYAEYEIRVVLVGSWYPSESIFITMPASPLAFCEVSNQYTISGSTCGNSDGSITIDNTDYELFYDFTLTDIDGNTFSYPFTGLTSNYYFLTATVKLFYQVLYGRDACSFDWIKIEDSDNLATLVSLSVRPQQCQPFDRQMGRIYYNISGLTSGHTYSFDAFTSDLSVYYSQTGITATTSFILNNCIAQCYWVRIRDEVTGCALLLDNRCVPSVALFSTGGVKKLYLASWSDDLDYNYWSTADDDYFLEFEDTSFFLSTKIKNYLSLTGGTSGVTWYEIPVLPQIVTVNQSLEKVRQGFIFTDRLTFGITKANATKWQQIATLINAENKWVYVIEDVSGFYWTGGYRHGARVTAYNFQTGLREEDNGYKLEITAVSENKLLTNLDENYVNTYIK